MLIQVPTRIKKVAEVVTKVNDDNTKVNMNEILKDLKVDTTETIKTNTEKKVNPSLWVSLLHLS